MIIIKRVFFNLELPIKRKGGKVIWAVNLCSQSQIVRTRNKQPSQNNDSELALHLRVYVDIPL